jgi:FMN phosphatase YigB (HAD superfamily)
MIKAVIYDIGGTLFESDTVGVDDRVFAGKKMLEMFKRHGFNFKFGPADMTAKVKTGEKEFKH